MRKNIYLAIVLFTLTTCVRNSQKEDKDDSFATFWDDCDVVAKYDIVNGDTILVCDAKRIKRKKVIPLDLLTKKLEMIKLDATVEDGWVNRRFSRVYFTDNYIAICLAKSPVLLFQKDGTFLRKVGKIGQGPGEFSFLDNICLDEKQNRIYILPMMSKHIFVYDFDGMFLQSIPLPEFIFMGSTLRIISGNRLLITKAIGPNTEYCLWVQDLDGNLIQGVKSEDYFGLSETTSVGTISKNTTNNIDFYMMGQYYNSYHYDIGQNRLKPVFRIEGEDGFLAIHEYPKHFIIQKTKSDPKDDETIEAIIVDKQTLKGCFFDGIQFPSGLIYNQYTLFFPMFNSFFSIADFGSEIMNSIQNTELDKLSNKQLKELEKLKNFLGDPIKYEKDDDLFIFRAEYVFR